LTFGTATSQGPRISFLNFWAHTRNAGARKVTNMRVMKKMHVMVHDSGAVNDRAVRANPSVKEHWISVVDACKRCRSIGKSANACTENNTRAKTATSVVRRDAKTIEADIAAFIDRTEVNRS